MSTSRLSTRRRVPAVLLTGVLLLAACSNDKSATTTSSAPPTTAPPTETTGASGPATFTFGYVRPATGLLSQLSTAQEAAIGLAIDDINAAGGINGGTVQLLAVDESPEGDTAAAVTDLLGKGANMVLGPISSDGAKSSLAALTTGKSVACSASATSPELTTLDTTNVLYRTAMPDSFTVGLVADAVSADAAAAKLPEGQQYKVSIVAPRRRLRPERRQQHRRGARSPRHGRPTRALRARQGIFTAEADKVKANGSGTTIMVSYGEGVRLVDTLITAGVPAASLIGLDGMFDPNLAQRASNTDPSRLDGVRVMGSTGDRAFIDRLAAVPDLAQLVYGAQAYDCAIAGALAAQAAKSSDPAGYGPLLVQVTDGGQSCSTVADCLSKLAAGDDIDYEGVSGGIRWDAAGDPAEARFTTASFTAGKMNEVSTDEINLDDVRQQEATAATIFNTQVQQLLAVLGYYSGPIDGQESEEMTAAIIALQTDLGVPPTGVWDEPTDTAVRAKYGDITGALSDSITGLQQLLTDLGFYSGPIDGIYSQAVVDAVKALQAQLGVPQTGIIDAATLKAAYDQGLQAGTPPPTTTAPSAPTTTRCRAEHHGTRAGYHGAAAAGSVRHPRRVEGRRSVHTARDVPHRRRPHRRPAGAWSDHAVRADQRRHRRHAAGGQGPAEGGPTVAAHVPHGRRRHHAVVPRHPHLGAHDVRRGADGHRRRPGEGERGEHHRTGHPGVEWRHHPHRRGADPDDAALVGGRPEHRLEQLDATHARGRCRT